MIKKVLMALVALFLSVSVFWGGLAWLRISTAQSEETWHYKDFVEAYVEDTQRKTGTWPRNLDGLPDYAKLNPKSGTVIKTHEKFTGILFTSGSAQDKFAGKLRLANGAALPIEVNRVKTTGSYAFPERAGQTP